MKKLSVSYEEMEKFILNNVEYTYNVKTILNDFQNNLFESGSINGIFETGDGERFEITMHTHEVADDEYNYTYDIEKL